MRTFEEIKADINAARKILDTAAMRTLAKEMQELESPEARIVVHNTLGSVHSLTRDFPAAVEHYQRALDICNELGDRRGVASVSSNIGLVYKNSGNYPAALEHFHRALAVLEDLGDRLQAGKAAVNIGQVHLVTGSYPAALGHLQSALSTYEELKYRRGVALVTGSIGMVHRVTGNYSAALEHCHRARAMEEELGDRQGVALNTGNIGVVHANAGNHQAALEHYRRALSEFEELGDHLGVVGFTGNIVSALIYLGEHKEARAMLQRMDAMQVDDPAITVEREQSRARLQMNRGDLDQAVETLVACLAIAREHSLAAEQAETHKQLRDLAQERNDLAGYVEHNNEHARITEEITGKETTQKMAMMEAERKMEAERSEREKERALLYGALPEHIATRMLRGESVEDHFENAAVLFTDIVGFTTNTSSMHPSETIKLLEELYKDFDTICAEHDTTKVKTIGDSYLCFSESAENVAAVAVKMLAPGHTWPDGSPLQLRIGIHAGPLSAGVIGTQRLQYDIWGDTVNVASRMESTGEPGRIHVSDAFADALRDWKGTRRDW